MGASLQEQLQLALGSTYQLERELGGGGMSRVFVAHERALGRKVVVKVLLPELAAGVNVERFRREIQLAAQLQHPHIVPLLSAGEAEGLPYFIMPYVTGESLRARLTREGEFPIADAVRTLRDVVSALAYAHMHGVVHRDIKPDNVLLSHGVAVVTDFGVAKAVSASSGSGGSTGLTSHGLALGTPAYMSPEQATASPHTDHRADIYSFGIMAYEMLTGAPPFSGRSAQAVLAAQVVEDPEPVERRRPAVPPLLATLVKDCLCKRPADRPQSAAQVMSVLDALVTPSGGTAATTAVRLQPLRSVTSPRWRRTAAGAVAVIALLLGGTLLVRQHQTPPASSSKSSIADSAESVTGAAPAPPTPTQPPVDAPQPPTELRKQERRPAGRAPASGRAQPNVPVLRPGTQSTRDSAPGDPEPATERGIPRMAAIATTPESAPAPTGVRTPAPPVVPPAKPAPEALPAPQAPPPQAPPPPATARDPRMVIRNVLSQYAAAIQSQSLSDIRRVYPGMTPMQQRGWEQFFQLVRDVKAELSISQLDVSNGTAETQVAGTYTYLNTSTGRTEHQPVAFHATFKLDGGLWRMIQVR